MQLRFLQRDNLHVSIRDKVWSSFIQRHFDEAVSAAFKRVEVRVRDLSGLKDLDSSKLMDEAFKTNHGPLSDQGTKKGEQDGIRFLFSGTYKAFRNPSNHRDVNFSSPQEVAEIILSANMLLRRLDRIEQRFK